jgi:IS30 family transposase
MKSGKYHAWNADIQAKDRRKQSKILYRKIDTMLGEQLATTLHPLISPEVVAHQYSIHHKPSIAGYTATDLICCLDYHNAVANAVATALKELRNKVGHGTYAVFMTDPRARSLGRVTPSKVVLDTVY